MEKFRSWSDCNGDVESVYTKDELLTNISIYWFSGRITSSFRIYYEVQHVKDKALAQYCKVFWDIFYSIFYYCSMLRYASVPSAVRDPAYVQFTARDAEICVCVPV